MTINKKEISGSNIDIAFESGALSKKVAGIYRKALAAEIAKNEEKEAKEIAFNLAVEKIKTAPEYKDLDQGIDGVKQVASNMRKELKAMFPGFKFSVRKGHCDSVYIKWADGPTEEKVKCIVDKYKAGRFNIMQDIYECEVTPFNKVYGGVQYLFTDREYSDELTEKAINIFNERFENKYSKEINLKKFKEGDLWEVGGSDFIYHNDAQNEISKIRKKLSNM